MQRTVGPCHRDRKQKRNEKSEEREGDSIAGREGGEEGGKAQGGWTKGVPPGDTLVVGQSQQEGLRQQQLLSGVDHTEKQGPWLWEEVEKGTIPRPQLLYRGQRAGKEEVPEQARSGHRNIKDQEKCLCPRVLGTSINAGESQALCHLELRRRAGEPSKGWKG